jgi:hypothetical protein
MNKQILIIGNARHGKDTVAEMIQQQYGLSFESSSVAAAKIFLFDTLKERYGYTSFIECFEDRVNHRQEWHDEICKYNEYDKARLAKDILKTSDMYVGMRSNVECEECLRQGVFDLVIGVYDPRKPLEPETSFDINLWEKSDIIIPNAGTLEDLSRRIELLGPLLLNVEQMAELIKPHLNFGDIFK